MPPKRKLMAEEELEQLRTLVAEQEKKLKQKDRQLAEERSKHTKTSHPKLIPRPKGNPGRKGTKGYNLQREMGLIDDPVRNQRLGRLVRSYGNQYLSTVKTISKQDKTRLEKTVKLIVEDVPSFQRFQGAWPVHDILTKHLQNSVARRKKDLDLEKKAQKDGSADRSTSSSSQSRRRTTKHDDSDEEDESEDNGADENEEGSENENEVNVKKTAVGDMHGEDSFEALLEDIPDAKDFRLQPADWDMEMEDQRAQKTPKHQQQANKENAGLEMEEDAGLANASVKPKPNKKRKVSSMEQGSPLRSSRKRYSSELDSDDLDSTPIAKKPKLKAQTKRKSSASNAQSTSKALTPVPLPRPVPAISLPELTRADLPDCCPANYCKEPVPQEPTAELLLLFRQKHDLVLREGKAASGAHELTRQICCTISASNRRLKLRTTAQASGWPLKIDFEEIPERVLALGDALLILVCDSTELEKCPVWLAFLDTIKYKVHAFSRAAVGSFSDAAERMKRCGYFGPKGQAIIMTTIDKMLSGTVPEDQIYQTVASLLNTPRPWDKPDRGSELISSLNFVDYILAPYVAASLIAEDLETTFEAAFVILSESSDFGDIFNDIDPNAEDSPDSRDTFFRIPSPPHEQTTVAPPVPSRRKEKYETITLDDFPAPVTKTKPRSSKTSQAKEKKPTVSSSHNHGTRSASRKT